MWKKTISPLMMMAACVVSFGNLPAHAESGDTLKAVKARGSLLCSGHNGSYLGFAEVDDKGQWRGYDIDLCRAMATAVFGTDEGHLKVVPVGWAQRFPSLQSGDLDVVIKATGWTFGRDTDLHLQFTRPYLVAPIRVMVHKSTGAEHIPDLNGGTICVPAGTTIERYMANYANKLKLDVKFVAIEKSEETDAAYLSGRCDAYAQWDVVLSTVRLKDKDPAENIILPDVMAAEPVAMVMRQGDDNWVDIGNWVLNALWLAEMNGITSKNVDEAKANPSSPEVAKLLGATPGIGKQLGLDSDDWAYNVIKKYGNAAEFWQRNLGDDSPYKLDRGVNSLFTEGGVFYPLVLD